MLEALGICGKTPADLFEPFEWDASIGKYKARCLIEGCPGGESYASCIRPQNGGTPNYSKARADHIRKHYNALKRSCAAPAAPPAVDGGDRETSAQANQESVSDGGDDRETLDQAVEDAKRAYRAKQYTQSLIELARRLRQSVDELSAVLGTKRARGVLKLLCTNSIRYGHVHALNLGPKTDTFRALSALYRIFEACGGKFEWDDSGTVPVLREGAPGSTLNLAKCYIREFCEYAESISIAPPTEVVLPERPFGPLDTDVDIVLDGSFESFKITPKKSGRLGLPRGPPIKERLPDEELRLRTALVGDRDRCRLLDEVIRILSCDPEKELVKRLISGLDDLSWPQMDPKYEVYQFCINRILLALPTATQMLEAFVAIHKLMCAYEVDLICNAYNGGFYVRLSKSLMSRSGGKSEARQKARILCKHLEARRASTHTLSLAEVRANWAKHGISSEPKHEVPRMEPAPPPPPVHFICPLSKQMFDDPVRASNGVVYERSAIEARFRLDNFGDPTEKSKEPLSPTLYKDTGLKSMIGEWKAKQARPRDSDADGQAPKRQKSEL